MIRALAKIRASNAFVAVGAEENPDKLSPGALAIFSSTFLFVTFVAYKKYGEPPTNKSEPSRMVRG